MNENYKIAFLDEITANNYWQEKSISSNDRAMWKGYSRILQKHILGFRQYGVVNTGSQTFLPWEKFTEDDLDAVLKAVAVFNKDETLSFVKSLLLRFNKYKDDTYKLNEHIRKINRQKDWRFPYEKIPANSRIVIYGAGNVGTSFVKQMAQTHYCHVAAWVDKNYEKLGSAARSPSEITDCEFDNIVVAVADTEISREIMLDLKSIGISDKKIITV